jgi:hypothetical protein
LETANVVTNAFQNNDNTAKKSPTGSPESSRRRVDDPLASDVGLLVNQTFESEMKQLDLMQKDLQRAMRYVVVALKTTAAPPAPVPSFASTAPVPAPPGSVLPPFSQMPSAPQAAQPYVPSFASPLGPMKAAPSTTSAHMDNKSNDKCDIGNRLIAIAEKYTQMNVEDMLLSRGTLSGTDSSLDPMTTTEKPVRPPST